MTQQQPHRALRDCPPIVQDTCPYMNRIRAILQKQWVAHVETHSSLYDELMIQSDSLVRVPFIRYERTIGEEHPWDGSVCFRPIPKLRDVIVYAYEEDAYHQICKDYYNEFDIALKDDLQHLEWATHYALKFQTLLQDMNANFPFSCRYYKWIPDGDYPFINPMPQEREKIQALFHDMVLEHKKINVPFINGDFREYAHWFVQNVLNDCQNKSEDFFNLESVIHNAMRMSEYLHAAIVSHYKHVSKIV